MKPWEIWAYDFEDEQSHPVVIFSNAVRAANADLDRVNVLLCTTMRGERHWKPKPHEVVLNSEDGLVRGEISSSQVAQTLLKGRQGPQKKRPLAEKAKSNRRLRGLCQALQREHDPAQIRAIKDQLREEFYFGDRSAPCPR